MPEVSPKSVNVPMAGHWLKMARSSYKRKPMRVRVAVNDGKPVRASLTSKGALAVRVNLANDAVQYPDGSLWIQAMDFSDEQNCVSSVWQVANLTVGDTVEIKVLDDANRTRQQKLNDLRRDKPTNLPIVWRSVGVLSLALIGHDSEHRAEV